MTDAEGRPIYEDQTRYVRPAAPAAHSTPEAVVVPTVPTVAAAPVAERRVVTRRSFSPAAVVTVAAAIFLAVVGAVAVARAGLDGPLDDPVVQVAGIDHTAILGLIEVGMALFLLWAGLSRDRGAILFVSILFGTAALVAAIEPSVGGDALAIERSWAVILVIMFAVIALIAALAPTVWRSTERVEVV